ncbi:MAG: tRNA (guanosine(46)-N7)-methyltransferase TrmB [Sulfurimonas sp.]|nr:tRNA (guanosine(46)-N7)-methyltransferase TrmB [Sulfurimonas sp.]
MPHLHIKKFNKLKFPYVNDGVNFNFIANNANRDDEKLISVTIENEDFFLLVREDENKKLLKTDKLTRPSSTQKIHNALLSYAKEAKLEILDSNVHHSTKNIHLKEVNALKNIEYFANKFPDVDDICIEVGFGSGRHLLHQAKGNPDILFIGIEIHRPSIEQVLKQVNIQKLDNLMILDYDARLFMELIPSNIISKIYIHFPVPWDKKEHRRVISTSFIEEAQRVLKVDARLELRTDSENYYVYSYETFINFKKISLEIKKNCDIVISSKYEDRWKKQEKNIYDVTMINKIFSDNLKIDGNFEFSEFKSSYEKLLKLSSITKKYDNVFIHFERVYTLEDGIMLRTSMGSFDRPEHLYVIVRNKDVSYYPTLPLKSKSNLVAHKFLDGVLNG